MKFLENPLGDLADARNWGMQMCASFTPKKKKSSENQKLVNALRAISFRSKPLNVMGEGENARKRIKKEMEE